MILKQFYLNCLAHASYLVADQSTGVAAVIDPQRDIDQYLAFATEHGLRIEHVLLTHMHADFVAGHLELREQGATIHLSARAKAEYAFHPLADGTTLEFGRVRLQALETPGHTPESMSLLVFDLERSGDEPHAAFTGDTLFVGDVGRPDLHASLGWTATDLGGMLYDSLRTKILTLPDACLVYPAHGAGSFCGKALGAESFSTIGEQRKVNYALQPMTREAFVAMVTADQPEAPAYFVYDAVLNSKERPTLGEALARELAPLSLDAVLAHVAEGAQLLDTRDPNDFCAAHLPGSLSIGLGGQYATWAGSLLDRERPIVLVAEPGREVESALRLGRIGFDHVVGFLEGGMAAVQGRPDLLQATDRLSPRVAAERLAATDPPVVIDVRNPRERGEKAIAGTRHIPLNRLGSELASLPADRPLVVHCAGGYRSVIAASLIAQATKRPVSDILGGIAAWEADGLPLADTAN